MLGVLRSVGRRLAVIGVGLLLALVVAEGLLQVGALYLRARGGEAATTSFRTGRLRILCLGDSNTYGLYLERSQAYPAQLQAGWDARPDLPPIEVLNLGVPGTNSSKLRSSFDRLLERFAPDVVLIMIGTNDAWTVPVPLADETASPAQALWTRSRVFRLLYMLGRAVISRTEQVSVEFVPPGQQGAKGTVRIGDEEIDLGYTARAPETASWPRSLRANLDAMIAQARARGVRPVLVTYPSTYMMYGTANDVIRAAARQHGTPLIDVGAAMRTACPSGACADLFLPDYHATARGNAIVAELVLRGLEPVLVLERES